MNCKDETESAAAAGDAEMPKTEEISETAGSRRSFLAAILGVGAVGVGAALAVPVARFALYPLTAPTTETAWSDVGGVDEFAALAVPVKRVVKIEQADGWRKNVSEKSVYVVAGANGQPRVLSAVCPHLGCAVAWKEERGQFVSPCHNGIFQPDGTLVSGPPRRSMDELESKIENNRLLVRYQYFRALIEKKEVVG